VELLRKAERLQVIVAQSTRLGLHFISSFVCFWHVFVVAQHFLHFGSIIVI
jgi:hypothetical protein